MTHGEKKLQTIETYNDAAQRMAEKFNDIGVRSDDISKAFSHVHKASPKVLEIGCGNGREAGEILKYTPDYLGIDISSSMIRLAQESLPDDASKFMVADVETFEFPA